MSYIVIVKIKHQALTSRNNQSLIKNMGLLRLHKFLDIERVMDHDSVLLVEELDTDSVITLTGSFKRSKGIRWFKLKVGVRVKFTNNYNGQLGVTGYITSVSKKKAVVTICGGGRYNKLKKNLRRIRTPD